MSKEDIVKETIELTDKEKRELDWIIKSQKRMMKSKDNYTWATKKRRKSSRAAGTNPRALGTNPRAIRNQTNEQ